MSTTFSLLSVKFDHLIVPDFTNANYKFYFSPTAISLPHSGCLKLHSVSQSVSLIPSFAFPMQTCCLLHDQSVDSRKNSAKNGTCGRRTVKKQSVFKAAEYPSLHWENSFAKQNIGL